MKCKYCNKEYIGGDKKKNVLIHENYCSENINRELYNCDICNSKFEKRHALIAHKGYCGNIKIRKSKPKKDVEVKVHKCRYCNLLFDNGYRLGGHVSHCDKDPDYEIKRKIMCDNLSIFNKGKKVSDETKSRTSKSMIIFLENNPDKVPYLLNHSRNESYPEKYFTDIFKKYNLIVSKYHRIGLYELDFCILNKKIDIEIDGDQHYLDKKIVESDKRRNEYLDKLGWDIIRVKWSEYKSLSKDNKERYIKSLILDINNLIKLKVDCQSG